MQKRQTDRRSRNLVDRDLQLKIIAQVSWPMALVMLVALCVFLMLGNHLETEAARYGADVTGLAPLSISAGILFLFALVSQVLIALTVSHRIAGSAYRVMATLREFRHGNRAARARLRKNDLHTRLANEVNEFLEWNTTQLAPGKPASSSSSEAASSKKEEAARV